MIVVAEDELIHQQMLKNQLKNLGLLNLTDFTSDGH
jgi:hypothetical protein